MEVEGVLWYCGAVVGQGTDSLEVSDRSPVTTEVSRCVTWVHSRAALHFRT